MKDESKCTRIGCNHPRYQHDFGGKCVEKIGYEQLCDCPEFHD